MIGDLMARDLAGGLGLGQDVDEVVPLRVSKKVLKVTSQPVFDAAFCLLGVGLEGAGE